MCSISATTTIEVTVSLENNATFRTSMKFVKEAFVEKRNVKKDIQNHVEVANNANLTKPIFVHSDMKANSLHKCLLKLEMR